MTTETIRETTIKVAEQTDEAGVFVVRVAIDGEHIGDYASWETAFDMAHKEARFRMEPRDDTEYTAEVVRDAS